MSVTPPSSWPWVDHPVSGLRHATDAPCSDSVSLRLPYSVKLATQRKSLTHYTKGTPSPSSIGPQHWHLMHPPAHGQLSRVTANALSRITPSRSFNQTPIRAVDSATPKRCLSIFKALPSQLRIYCTLIVLLRRSALTRAAPRKNQRPIKLGSDCLYAYGFRIYCTPHPGFFSPFPHGTGSLSVDHEYLALEDGPPMFRQDFTCPALLVARLVPQSTFRLRGSHPLWPSLPGPSAK